MPQPRRTRPTGRATQPRPSHPDAPPSQERGLQRLTASRSQTSSTVQQRFTRLIKQVEQRKQRLRTWYDAKPAIHRELARYQAAFEAYHRAGHDLVRLCDRAYANPIFTRADRDKLTAIICQIAGDLLANPGHDDLKPIYNRYSRSDFDAEAAMDDAASAHVMKTMMEQVFGMDFGDADVSSTEKLQAHTEAQLREREREEQQAQDRRARRKKSAKQVAREAQREADKQKVGKVLQEVYRRLAIALHPDLEQDPTERARKTELMQQVNVAYEAGDLLQLLELQLRFEQIDPRQASAEAEDRLRHYNTILDQQAKELDLELAELELPWRLELELGPSAPLSPARVLAQITADTAQLEQQTAGLRRDLEAFQDVTRLKAWLNPRGAPRRRRRRDPDLFR